jgi:hypothetical protein
MTSSTSRNDERIESSALQLLDGCIASHRAGELEEWELQLVRRRLLQSESGLNQSHEQRSAVAAIQEHNKGCLEACGKTSSHQYVRDSRRCDERRDCPDCPKDWLIEWPSSTERTSSPDRGNA